MGHSLNILGLRSGRSYKWKIFFISSHLVNYYYDHTIFFYFIYKYIIYLFRYKYYKILTKGGLLYSHMTMDVVKQIKIKIYVYNKYWLLFEKKLKKVLFISLKKYRTAFYKRLMQKKKLSRLKNVRIYNKYKKLFKKIFFKKRRPKKYRFFKLLYNQLKKIKPNKAGFLVNLYKKRYNKRRRFNFDHIFKRKNFFNKRRFRFRRRKKALKLFLKVKKVSNKNIVLNIFILKKVVKDRFFILFYLLKIILIRLVLFYLKHFKKSKFNLLFLKLLQKDIFFTLKKMILKKLYTFYRTNYLKLVKVKKNNLIRSRTIKNKIYKLYLLIIKLKKDYLLLKIKRKKQKRHYNLLYKIKKKYKNLIYVVNKIINKKLYFYKIPLPFFNYLFRVTKKNKIKQKTLYIYYLFLKKKIKKRKYLSKIKNLIIKYKKKKKMKNLIINSIKKKINECYNYFILKRYNKKNNVIQIKKEKNKINLRTVFFIKMKKKAFKFYYKKLFILTKEGKICLNINLFSFLIFLMYKKKKKNI